ncbi:MAG: sigma-70 family RNA polymerase sigma factor [Lysobacter sp.]|nr:sigma-70 family RNA polymerase sigma factor [Lysobacter sp.]
MSTALTIDALIQLELPAARNGDQGAYGRIVAACQNTVTAVALAITRDVATSEDIAQEAFLNAWQHLERLHSPDSFLPWLRQITRNLARDHLRAHRNQPLDGPSAELIMAMAADPGPQPMQQALEDERENAAFELISSLPDDSREALLLFYREGQSSQQVAALLGISDAAARKRLSRARQLVRDDILKRFGDFASSSAPSAAFTAAVITTLGMVAKPAAAAGATAIGTASIGGGIASKGLAVILGMGSLIGMSMVGGAIAAQMTRKYLLVFADTLEERDAILRSYQLYFYVTMSLMLVAFLVAWWVPSFGWAMTATLATEFASLWTLLRIHRVLQPMIARDAIRDPVGAACRYRAYDYSYGPTAIVITGVLYVGSMAIFYLGVHYSVDAVIGTIRMLAEQRPS